VFFSLQDNGEHISHGQTNDHDHVAAGSEEQAESVPADGTRIHRRRILSAVVARQLSDDGAQIRQVRDAGGAEAPQRHQQR
jgi:hypothetical protein